MPCNFPSSLHKEIVTHSILYFVISAIQRLLFEYTHSSPKWSSAYSVPHAHHRSEWLFQVLSGSEWSFVPVLQHPCRLIEPKMVPSTAFYIIQNYSTLLIHWQKYCGKIVFLDANSGGNKNRNVDVRNLGRKSNEEGRRVEWRAKKNLSFPKCNRMQLRTEGAYER